MLCFKVYFCVAFVAFANALQNGAPPQACDSMTPTHDSYEREDRFSSPFFVSVDSLGMNRFEVTINTVPNGPQFRGAFLQARLAVNGNSSLGSWESPEGDLFKLADCHSNPSGALTHASNVDKTMPFTFVWQAPEVTSDASYTIYATIVQEFSIFYVRIPSQPVSVSPLMEGTAETVTTNGSAEGEIMTPTQSTSASDVESTSDGGNSSQKLTLSFSLGLASLLLSILHWIARFF